METSKDCGYLPVSAYVFIDERFPHVYLSLLLYSLTTFFLECVIDLSTPSRSVVSAYYDLDRAYHVGRSPMIIISCWIEIVFKTSVSIMRHGTSIILDKIVIDHSLYFQQHGHMSGDMHGGTEHTKVVVQ